jgi:hypothetical protein
MTRLMLFLLSVAIPQTTLCEPKPCSQILTALYPDWNPKLPREKQARVEVRNCGTADQIQLQIVAWTAYATEPAVVAKTGPGRTVWAELPDLPGAPRLPTIERTKPDSRVVRIVMAGNVFLLETAGEGGNLVTVLLFDKGSVDKEFQIHTTRYLPVVLNGNKLTFRWWSDDGIERVIPYSTGLR